MKAFHHQTEDKLIILYVLNKIKIGLSREQIADIIMQNLQINYFDIQILIDELIKEKLILVVSDDIPQKLAINVDGSKTVENLSYKIPDYTKELIDAYIKNNRNKITKETIPNSTYEEIAPGDFQVHLSLTENEMNLLSISMSAPTEEDAIQICKNWKDNTQKIYASVIKDLVR